MTFSKKEEAGPWGAELPGLRTNWHQVTQDNRERVQEREKTSTLLA